MKKLLFTIIFLGINILSFGSNVYFLNMGSGYIYTNGQTFYSNQDGYASVNYRLWADPTKYSVGEWGANSQDPDGNWSGWSQQSSPEGLKRCLKAGTWHVKGRVWVSQDIYGYSNYWMYTGSTLYFYVVDNLAPSAPSGVSITSQNNHPKISWSLNSEYDFDYYEIYKKDGGSFQLLATTTSTSYVDTEEEVVSGQQQAYQKAIYYKIKAKDINNNVSSFSDQVSIVVEGDPLNKFGSDGQVYDYELSQNYPNPFNPTTSISYDLKNDTHVTIKIFNSVGQYIITLISEFQSEGRHSIQFDASDLPSGTYIYSLTSENFSDSKKMLLVK